MDVSSNIFSYLDFRSVVDLGINIGVNDLKFEDAMMYTWIKGALDERKT